MKHVFCRVRCLADTNFRLRAVVVLSFINCDVLNCICQPHTVWSVLLDGRDRTGLSLPQRDVHLSCEKEGELTGGVGLGSGEKVPLSDGLRCVPAE